MNPTTPRAPAARCPRCGGRLLRWSLTEWICGDRCTAFTLAAPPPKPAPRPAAVKGGAR